MKIKPPLSSIFLAAAIAFAAGCSAQTSRNNSEAKSSPASGGSRRQTQGAGAWKETLAKVDEPLTSSGRNRYFILEPGYRLELEGKEGAKNVRLVITVLAETKMVDEVETRVLEERESANGNLVEVSRNYCAMGKDSGNAYYFGEDVDVFEGGKVRHEGAWLAGSNGAAAGILMPGRIRIGDRYYQEKAPRIALDRAENVSTNETVVTPAGRFSNCLKVTETTPLESGREFKFYAPDVGLIQDGSLRLVKHGFVNASND